MLIDVWLKFIKLPVYAIKSKMTVWSYGLICITALSLALRLLEVNPGAPFVSPDEPIIKDSAIRIGLSFNFKPTDYYYGQLLPIIYGFMYVIFFIPLLFVKFFVTHIRFFIDHGLLFSVDFFRNNVLLTSDPTNYFHYAARYSTAMISSFTVIPVYFLGKKLFNGKVGLVAAFLTALNYRHLLSSNVVLADAPAAFFSSLSVLLSVVLLKNKSKKAYVFAGIGMALSLSVKYFVYVIPVFFVCHVLSFTAKKISPRIKIKKIVFNKNLALSLVICIFLFIIINPYLILDSKTAQTEFFLNSQRYGLTSYKPNLFNFTRGEMSLIPFYYLFWIGITPLVSIFAVAGFIYGLLKFTRSTFILCSIVLPFLFVFSCIFGDPFFRNFSAIIPFILFFPAIIIVDVCSKLKKTYALRFIALTTLIIILPSFVKSFITTLDYMKPHNEAIFGEWVDENIPQDKVGSFIAMQILRDEGVLEIDGNYSIYKTEQVSSISDMDKRNIRFVAVSSYKPPIKNRSIWLSRHLVTKSFFNKNLFWSNIENTYDSLLLQELSEYSVAQFLKTFDHALDRAIFVAKIPDFFNTDLNNKLKEYTFDSTAEQKNFSVKSANNSFNPTFIEGLGHMNSKGILLNASQCDLGTVISSNKLSVKENRLYSFTGLGRRNGTIINNDNGFLRLDFYSKDNTKLKTYVSGLLKYNYDWQKLIAIGLAPKSSSYAIVSMQTDTCLGGKIIFDNLDINYSSKSFNFDKQEYPFYGQKIPRNFLWSSEN